MDYKDKIREILKDTTIPPEQREKLEEILLAAEKCEDERIRKEMIAFLQETIDTVGNSSNIWTLCNAKKWIAWLEKQGTPAKLSEEEQNRFAKGVLSSCALSFINYLEAHKYEGKMCVSNGECEDIENAFQNAMWDRLHRYYCKYIERQGNKPQGKSALEAIHEQKADNANKVERKFKVGDYIVNDYCKGKVIELTTDAYLLDTEQGIPFSCEHNAHLWTLADAREGDVLYLQHDGKEHIIIYKGVIKERFRTYVSAYCAYNGIVEAFCFADVSRYADIEFGGIMPATKEQADFLFAKMEENGYRWNSKEKRLMKTPKPKEAEGVLKELLDEMKEQIETTESENMVTENNKELSISLQIEAYLTNARDELYANGKPLHSESHIKDINKCIKMWAKLHNAYFYGIKSQIPSENVREELLEHCCKQAEMYDNLITGNEYRKIQSWIDWLKKQGERNDYKYSPLYIRFGDIPQGEKSTIYCGEKKIGCESGVSVYPAFIDINGNIVCGLTLPITKTTLHTQQHLFEYDNRPCYLVTGDYVGKGSDGEPLINNVKILRRITEYRVKT